MSEHFASYIPDAKQQDSLCAILEPVIRTAFDTTTTRDAQEQMEQVAAACSTPLIEFLVSHACSSSKTTSNEAGDGQSSNSPLDVLIAISSFRKSFAAHCSAEINTLRTVWLEGQSQARPGASLMVSSLLARGTRPMYEFIRTDLAVGMRGSDNLREFEGGFQEPLVGEDVSVVYESIKDGRMANLLAGVLKDLDIQ